MNELFGFEVYLSEEFREAGSNKRVPSGGVKNNDDLFYSSS